MATKKLNLELQLPEELVEALGSVEDVTRQARESFVMDLLRQGKISQGKAAKLLELSRWDLPEVMAQHDVPAVMVEPDELERDWQAYQQNAGSTG